MSADIYEIVPATPYTSADLNYNNSGCRANTEMNDPSCRPAISGSVANMDNYDIVLIGYPIWWGEALSVHYSGGSALASDVAEWLKTNHNQ